MQTKTKFNNPVLDAPRNWSHTIQISLSIFKILPCAI